MKKKYIVFPGYVKSTYDKQMHYITGQQLIGLYGINPNETIVAGNESRTKGLNLKEYICLYPQNEYEDFKLPLKTEEKMNTKIKIEQELKKGGYWLGAARNWMQWNLPNGDNVNWNSNDICTLTVKQLEDLALSVATRVLLEERKNNL